MVAGPVEPSDGKLMLWRRDSREKAQHPLSFVFREATLMPWSSVRNNVRLPLDLAGVPRAEGNTRVSEVLSWWAGQIRRRPAARTLRRHANARLHRPRPGHPTKAAADG